MFSKSGKTQARPRSKCMLKRKPKLIYHIQDKNNKFHSTLAKILNLKNKTKQRKTTMVQIQTYTTKRYIIHTITFHFYHLEGKVNGKQRS
jgi:hypothetical protein